MIIHSKLSFKFLLMTLGLMIVLGLVSCSSTNLGSSTNPGARMTSAPALEPALAVASERTQTLTVYAAASLTDAFQEVGSEFSFANPSVRVEFSFAGSQILRTQLEQGAMADIYASADHNNLDLLISAGLIASDSSRDFATNQLVVILPAGNPARIETLHDLANPGLKLVLADPSVPAGRYARQVLDNFSKNSDYGADFSSNVLSNLVSNETDVRQAVTKVQLGEVDAGIVYESDAVAGPELITIVIPDQFNVIARYPIAILVNSQNPLLAAAFISYLASSEGQIVMSKWGFSQGQ